ncbi:MAG: hypothetical protein V2J24_20080 [Pseudomonadales bacterium]|nr:hypothetical protein [Pseudomonadales bacterium]
MEDSKVVELLAANGTDLAIALFAIGAVLGSSAWIVGAGIVAGANMARRIASGEFMRLAARARIQRRAL